MDSSFGLPVNKHAIVIHLSDGTRAGMGSIDLVAPTGNFEITTPQRPLKRPAGYGFVWKLKGLKPKSTGGWHVHEGTDCTTDACVGAPYYTAGTTDPWTDVKWQSDVNGEATDSVDPESKTGRHEEGRGSWRPCMRCYSDLCCKPFTLFCYCIFVSLHTEASFFMPSNQSTVSIN